MDDLQNKQNLRQTSWKRLRAKCSLLLRAKRSQTLRCAALARETFSDIMFHCSCARNALRRFATLADALARPPRSARSSTMPKPTPFQPGHTLEYAVEVVSRDAKGTATCWCLFCVHEGRDEVEIGQNGRKWKRTAQIKMFTAPFYPHKYRSHHESQHAE